MREGVREGGEGHVDVMIGLAPSGAIPTGSIYTPWSPPTAANTASPPHPTTTPCIYTNYTLVSYHINRYYYMSGLQLRKDLSYMTSKRKPGA